MPRKNELYVINKISEKQNNVSRQIDANVNMSLQAIEQYKTLIEKYKEIDEKATLAYGKFGKAVEESEEKLRPVFDLISNKLGIVLELQQWLVDQFTDTRTLIFYFLAYMSTFVATIFKRTASARFSIMTLITVNYFCEQHVAKIVYVSCHKLDSLMINNNISQFVDCERKLLVFTCVCLFIYKSVTYQNYHITNNLLLKGVVKKLRRIERLTHFDNDYANKHSKRKPNM